SGVSQSSLPDLIRQSVGLEAMDTRVKPACDEVLPLRLLRLVLLDRSAGIAPGGETAAHMSDRLQPHVLRGFGRQHRTQSASAMKDELLVALEDRLRVGTRRVDPEFQHAAGTGERAGNAAIALDFARIANVDDHDILALRGRDGVCGADRLDLRIGLVDQRLDAAMDGLGHVASSLRGTSTAPVPSS